jgi:hypothetical protein
MQMKPYYNGATMTIQNLCQSVKSGNGEECDGGDEQAGKESQVPKFDKEVSGFEAVRRYFYSSKNDDTSLRRPEHLERGEVNSVKNTTINIWLNDGVY